MFAEVYAVARYFNKINPSFLVQLYIVEKTLKISKATIISKYIYLCLFLRINNLLLSSCIII